MDDVRRQLQLAVGGHRRMTASVYIIDIQRHVLQVRRALPTRPVLL